IHGTTIVTNTILELSGAKVGLITTKGFRDILEIGRSRRPEAYNLSWQKPPTLIPRYLRLEVDERIDAQGEIIRPLEVNDALEVMDKLIAHGVESVAVCLFNSPHNPIHEQKIGQLLRERAPQLYTTLSTEIMSMLKETERTSEVVINAYVMPVLTRYMKSLVNDLAGIGVKKPVYVMQSSGGMTTPEVSMNKPIEIIECGPAAGVVGSHYLANKLGIENIITFDMGGTTTKASIIEDGEYTRAMEYEVAAGIHKASRLLKGSGYILRVPSIDIAEVGSGGGSIIWMDKGGMLNVGPTSAGAVPGPICYNLGGVEPTLTDCYVILGYLNSDYLLGGSFKINAQKAYSIIEKKIAKPLGRDIVESAYGAYELANSNMVRAITAVSVERGRDPRNFSLLCFGGAGSLHAVAMAQALQMKRVVVAPHSGIFSAFGLLFADIERNYVQSFMRVFNESALAAMDDLFRSMTKEAIHSAEKWGYKGAKIQIDRYADLRYYRQTSEITIPIFDDELNPQFFSVIRKRFDEQHKKNYDFSLPESTVQVINLRIVAKIPRSRPALPEKIGAGSKPSQHDHTQQRKAYFGKNYGSVTVPVLSLEQFGQNMKEGPLIIESYDTTMVIPHDCTATIGPAGTVIIDIKN
ncbi:MAG: hydantoinase/oxoprolinase family protein, partial [Dehalococcoidales bacterium]